MQLEARVRLSQVNQANRDEDAHNDADGKHPEHELCSPAPVHAVASHHLSMAEGQRLRIFESLSGQQAQLISKLSCGGPQAGAGTPIPPV